MAAAHGVGQSDVERMISLYGVRTPALLDALPPDAVPGLSRLDRAHRIRRAS